MGLLSSTDSCGDFTLYNTKNIASIEYQQFEGTWRAFCRIVGSDKSIMIEKFDSISEKNEHVRKVSALFSNDDN